jgi:hypothetical protein
MPASGARGKQAPGTNEIWDFLHPLCFPQIGLGKHMGSIRRTKAGRGNGSQ